MTPAISGFSPAWWAGHDHAASGGITAPDDMPDEFYEGMEAWRNEQSRCVQGHVAGALVAVRHDKEWHLAECLGDAYRVIGTGMQSGDCWLPEWVDRVVLVAEAGAW